MIKRNVNNKSASLGYSKWYKRDDMNGLRSITTRAVNEAVKRGVICVVAAGNYGKKGIDAPADSFYGIAVGSVTLTGAVII